MKSLTNTFKEAVCNNAASAWFVHQSERVAALCYLTNNVVLLSKNGADANLETAAGGIFLIATVALWKGKDPFYMKAAGWISIAGALCLGAAGLGQPGAVAQGLSAIPAILTGYLITKTAPDFDAEENAEPSKKAGYLSNTFNRATGMIKNYPIFSGGVIDFPGGALLLLAAIQKADLFLGVAATAWCLGAFALSASDPGIKKIVLQDDAAPQPETLKQQTPS